MPGIYRLLAAASALSLAAILASPSHAHAMHIAEGILPLNWALIWFALAAPFFWMGMRRMSAIGRDDLSIRPLVGLMAAIVFIISCMPVPVPIAGTCSHPVGTGIPAVLLGPAISVVITAAALLIQALLMAHGGLSTLGADIVSMGVAGAVSAYLIFKLSRGLGASLGVAGFLAGLAADWATYTTTAAELALGLRSAGEPFMPLFTKIMIAFVPTQLPLGILEGAITSGMVVLLYKRRPDILVKLRVLKQSEVAA